MNLSIGKIVLGILAGLILIQLIPLDRTNPPVESDIPAPASVKALLKRACYDCHSHETVWPWYSYLAPISWLIVWDVHEGREDLNFSTWNRYSRKEQKEKLEETREEIQEGEMPPWIYLPLHPDARLASQEERELVMWSTNMSIVLGEEED